MLCSNTSPNHLDFRLHDSGMPWVFLGWTSQKIRILGSKFLLCFLLLCYPCCVNQWMFVPASVEVILLPRSGGEAFEGPGSSGVHRPQDVSQSHWGLAVFSWSLCCCCRCLRRNIFSDQQKEKIYSRIKSIQLWTIWSSAISCDRTSFDLRTMCRDERPYKAVTFSASCSMVQEELGKPIPKVQAKW